MEIVNWSHDTWNTFVYTAILHPCPDVIGLLLQCYMAWTESSNLCTSRLPWKKKTTTKFSSLSPSCTAEFSLKKIQRQPWAEIPWELLCAGTGMRQTCRKKILSRCICLGELLYSRDSISLELFIQQGNSALSVLLHEIPLLLERTRK